MNKRYETYSVFTPSQPAELTFVDREEVNKQLVDSIRTPGRQLIVYGFRGSGKTTLINNKLYLYSASLRKEAFRLKVALFPALFSASLQIVRPRLCCLWGTYALNRFRGCLMSQWCKISFVSAHNVDWSSLKDPSSSIIKIIILILIFPLIPCHPFSCAEKTGHLWIFNALAACSSLLLIRSSVRSFRSCLSQFTTLNRCFARSSHKLQSRPAIVLLSRFNKDFARVDVPKRSVLTACDSNSSPPLHLI